MEMFFRIRVRAFLLTVLSLIFVLTPALKGFASGNNAASHSQAIAGGASSSVQASPYYYQVLAEWEKEGIAKDQNTTVTIPATTLYAHSKGANATIGNYSGKSNVLVWNTKSYEWVEFKVNVPKDGLYGIGMTYHPFVDQKNQKPISFNIAIDGKTQYRESSSVQLYRHWQDQFPIKTDSSGDEIRPMAKDISGWMTWQLRDLNGSYEDPLMWHFSAGEHIIRLSTNDPVALSSIKLDALPQIQDYQQVMAGEPQNLPPVQVKPIVIQAEKEAWKNDSSIPLTYDNDIGNSPYVTGKIVYNTIGGNSWSSGNQEISWSFNVPQSGIYKIAMRALQAVIPNQATFRTILVNGHVPFSQLKAYRFQYQYGWQAVVLSDKKGAPFKFYLHKGVNTLSMRVTEAPFFQIAQSMNQQNQILNKLYTELNTLTGGVTDSNRTWDINKEIPGFVQELQGVYNKLEVVQQQLVAANGRQDAISQVLTTIRQDINNLLQNPNAIPYNASRFIQLQSELATEQSQVGTQPLQLDRIVVVPYNMKVPKLKASFWEKLIGGIRNFLYSFKPQHTAYASPSSRNGGKVLNVWMLRGRDYVNLLQQLADATFTPKTGIKVQVHLLKDEKVLMLMNAAGNAPDVALGLSSDLTFNYAIRNAIYNIKKFPDFNTVYQRFAPGMWLPYYYEDGYYGVPVTTTMDMMYYRKDIFQRYGLKVPNTWEDLYKILPVLQQNGMNFPPVADTYFLQMHGVQYYNKDGTKVGFDNPQGFSAFKSWTDLQNKYGLDQNNVSFYQHFRDGSYPIGIADLNTYIQLKVAAPELNGLWGMAPLPGVKQKDGSVVRWASGNLTGGMIFKHSKMLKQSWEFLKWWTSAQTQTSYGNELENLDGITFRWNTANVAAFSQLPWSQSDLNEILQQWKWYRGIPNVPGNYYFQRTMLNAWTRTVVDGQNYRISLDTFIQNMNREIARREVEFKIISRGGKLLRPLDLPVINQPWNGVNPYVKN